MKKTLKWAACGLGLATVCGLAGMPHLSASVVALTAFCAAPALLFLALNALPHAVREGT
ncbi:hypothetical protein [Hoeflea sp. BAL378]|uniref:hypothetical protein n=1 Tax=Hoeflea sp. BAL378 TaxID=1547437 RepID=UPI0013778BBD|nr:hypothetical protein [Hoeflea sp. BAL378]